MKRKLFWVIWTAFCLAGLGHAQEKYTLRFAPAAETKWQEKITGEVVDVLLQGQAMGLTGKATADVHVTVLASDPERKETTLQLALEKVEAELNGQPSVPGKPEPLKMIVDERGKTKLPEADKIGITDWIETGLVPVHLIAILAHMLRLPEQPVACGEEWACEDVYRIPGIGDVPMNTRWKLMSVEGDLATIAATAAAIMPDFRIANPMAPGTEIDVRAARMIVTEMKQVFDMAQSRLQKSEATVKMEAQLDMGGFQMPVLLTLKCKLEPLEPKAEA